MSLIVNKKENFPLILILPIVTPTNNKLLRLHFRERKRLKESYMWELVAIGANLPEFKVEFKEKRIIEIRSFRKSLADNDNLTGGMKYLIDAIKEMGLIYDDGPEYLEIKGISQYPCLNQRTEIIISLEENNRQQQ